MKLSYKQIIKLPVYTQSNHYVGEVCDFEIDSEQGKIVYYHVKSGGFIKGLLGGDKLIVHCDQVISLDDKKLVVKDSVKKEKVVEEIKEMSAEPVQESAPTIPSQRS